MTQQNSSRFGTAFTETIEAREGSHDRHLRRRPRAHNSNRYRAGRDGVGSRPSWPHFSAARPQGWSPRARGTNEASVDLARLAGLTPSGVICEIMNDDGTMARVPDLIKFCAEHGLKMLTVAELIRYRLQNERYITRAAESQVRTRYGDFRMIAYESEVNGGESHVALVHGSLCEQGSTWIARTAPT